MPVTLFKRLNEQEEATFKKKGMVPRWYKEAARALEGGATGLKDPSDFPTSNLKAASFKEGKGGSVESGQSLVDLSGKKDRRKGKDQDKKSSKYAKNTST